MTPESNQSSQEASTVRGFGEPSSGTSTSLQCPALRSVLAIAGVAAAASLTNPSEAAIIASNSLFNVKVRQGGIPATSFTDFVGLVTIGAAINFGTRATAGGSPSANDYARGVMAWGGPGSGQFLRYSQIGLNAASLLNLGQAGNGFNKTDGFANINLASVFSGTYSNTGNPAFSGASPSTSKYLMPRFTSSGADFYYG